MPFVEGFVPGVLLIGLFMSKNIIENGVGGRTSVRNVAGGAELRIEV